MDNNWKQLASQGEALYKKKICKKLLPQAKGKFAVIDVKSENYFLGNTLLDAFKKARQKYPSHKFHFVRVGHPAAVSFKHRTRP